MTFSSVLAISKHTFSIWSPISNFTLVKISVWIFNFTTKDFTFYKLAKNFCTRLKCHDALAMLFAILQIAVIFSSILKFYFANFYFLFCFFLLNLLIYKLIDDFFSLQKTLLSYSTNYLKSKFQSRSIFNFCSVQNNFNFKASIQIL